MNTRPSHLETALHFCGSCLATVGCWAAWLVLGGTLVTLLYVAVAKELPVPGFVLRRVEAELARANLSIHFGRASFDPTGKLLLEDVQLHAKPFGDPLITARQVYLRRSIWSVLAGRPVPDEIRLHGATLQLPGMLSPTGVVEPLMRDLAVTLRHREHLWLVDQFTGRIGPLAVTAQGEFTVPARSAGAAPLALEKITARFLQASRKFALEVRRLDAFDEPALTMRLESAEGIGNTATLLFTARAAHPARLFATGPAPGADLPLALGPLAVSTTLRLDGTAARPVRLHAAIRRANYRGGYALDHVRGVLTAQINPADLVVRPLEALVAAGTLTAEGEQALGPVLRANLARWPDVHATGAVQIRGEFLAAEVEARLRQQSAHIRAEGRVAPGLISSVLTKNTPRAAPYFAFGDPVAFHAVADLGPGWRFAGATARVAAGRIDSRGVKLTAARGRIDITGRTLLASDARVELGEQLARGSYWMDFSTTDYRLLLHGRLRPTAINGWFNGDWWRDFWENKFSFPALPEADVDVQGRWKEAARTVYFGRAGSAAVGVLGADFEQVHTLVFLRPSFTHALELSATRAGATERLAGSFKRFTDETTRETSRLEFEVDANADPEVYRRMAGGAADVVLDPLRFTQPPQVHAEGVVTGRWPGAKPDITFRGTAAGGLYYYGLPLETVTVAGGMTGSELRLDDIRFSLAGGKGAGKAWLGGPPEIRRLGFEIGVTGADLAGTIRAVGEFEANRTGRKDGPMPDSDFMKHATGGKLDVSLAATGAPGDLASFTGNGNAALSGAELAEVQLFGLLSQVLSGLSLSFSSLKLDAARTSFKMDQGRLHFPDLKVSGPSAVIDAWGNYTFASNALDFSAKFKPFEESRNPLTAVIGIVINPIASIMELKLSGPLSKPEWSIVVGPSSPRPESSAAVPPLASPPAEASPKPEKDTPPKS